MPVTPRRPAGGTDPAGRLPGHAGAGRPAAARARRRRRRRRAGRVAARSATRAGERPGAVAGEGRGPRARPARHRSRRRRARRRRAPRRRGRLRPDHQAARPRGRSRWSTSTSRCCRGGAGAAPVERAILAGDERDRASTSWPWRRGSTPAASTGAPRCRSGPTTRSRSCEAGWWTEGTRLLVRRCGRASARPRAAGRRADLRRQAHAPTIGTSTGAVRPSTSTAGCASATPGRPTTASASRCGARTCLPSGDGPRVRAGRRRGRARRGPARGQGPDGRQGVGQRRPVAPRRPARHVTLTARQLALDALDRIERDGAYANLLLPELLQRSSLEARDRHFATELVYGTTRMKRACDFLVDRFVARELDLRVRNALRLGAYQLHFLADAPARGGGGDGRDRAQGRARPRERRPPPGRRGRRRLARRRDPPQLSRLDRRSARPRPRPEDASRRPRA